jgi:hypothetical protein
MAGDVPLDARRAGAFFVQAFVTFVVAVFAWLALDDITTDNSTGFLPEYRLLAAAGAWCLFLAGNLLKHGHRALGLISVAFVVAAVVVCSDGLGHVRDGGWRVFWPEYGTMLATWLWFVALSFILVALGRHAGSAADAQAS